MKFRGVLVRLDEPSTRPPNGAEGHRIYVPTAVAAKRLQTLVGMGLNYAENLDGHQQRRKVGVIQKANIEGKDLWVEGIVWKHDFPEATDDLKQKNLGMSMEIGQVAVDDINADVWVLNDFYFLGATILFRDAAAYERTQAIAAQANKGSANMKKPTVTKPAAVQRMDAGAIAQIATQAAVEGVSKHFAGTFNRQTNLLARMAAQFEDVNSRLTALEAGAVTDDEDDDEIDDIDAEGNVAPPPAATAVPKMTTKKKVAAADDEDDEDDEDKKADEDDDEEIESEAIDKGDLEEMGPDTAGGDLGTPAHQNEDDENKGSRTTLNDDVGKTVASAALKSLRKQVAKLTAGHVQLQQENKRLKKQLAATHRQVTAAANDVTRRSRPIHNDVQGLLAKSGLDPMNMQASSQKLSVAEVDALIASSLPNVDVTTRMTLKNKMLEMGLMEEGAVHRQLIPRG